MDIVDRRWESFIMISNNEDEQVQPMQISDDCETPASNCVISDVDRMLAVAVELHYRLHSICTLHDNGLQLTMGIASGSTTLLGSGFGASWISRGALSTRGDAADLAQEMAGVCGAGAVAVHESALWRWAAAGPRLPPACDVVTVVGGERRLAGMFDLGLLDFRRLATETASFGRAASLT
jgi:class 3 adenylate cyclase